MTVTSQVDLYHCDFCGYEVASKTGLPAGWVAVKILVPGKSQSDGSGTSGTCHLSPACAAAAKTALAVIP